MQKDKSSQGIVLDEKSPIVVDRGRIAGGITARTLGNDQATRRESFARVL
jgi:hypothetical protein